MEDSQLGQTMGWILVNHVYVDERLDIGLGSTCRNGETGSWSLNS